jgi:hypothetical protein
MPMRRLILSCGNLVRLRSGPFKKDIWNELILITVSAVSIYGAGYGLWRFARYMDEKPASVAVKQGPAVQRNGYS